jgi:hypothetical protein
MLKEITKKVLNCDDIPYEISGYSWLCDYMGNNNTYIEYSLSIEDNDELASWIKQEYPELIGHTFLIQM